jgi:hypothetical protein
LENPRSVEENPSKKFNELNINLKQELDEITSILFHVNAYLNESNLKYEHQQNRSGVKSNLGKNFFEFNALNERFKNVIMMIFYKE